MPDNKNEMKNSTKNLFNTVSALFDSSGPRYFASFGERLVELSEIKEGNTVLDVAAGRGASLFPAAAKVGKNGSVIGIDIAEGMVRETSIEIEKRSIKNAKIIEMDAENINFSDKAFDYVLCGFGIFFFPEYEVALKEFLRVLKEGGRFGFTTFSRKDDENLWLKELMQKYMPAKEEKKETAGPEFDTEEGLYKILSENGFGNIQIIYEEKEFIYKDENEWWEKLWSQGSRRWLELLPPDKLEEFKSDVFERINKNKKIDGFHTTIPVLYAFGIK